MSADINEIIDHAFELTGVEREAYLSVACDGDTHLRDNVNQLLVGLRHSAPPDFMEGPIHLTDSDFLDGIDQVLDFASFNSTQIQPGQHIDAYKIIERLGQGGMGEVYLAVRDDGAFTQKVAIKVVCSAVATEEVYKRFQYERQILANLSHPNIAQLLFGGVTTDGLPYFVMEYVEEGIPINEYCDTHQLTIKERLNLFKKVCDAVRYAQRNLVVHRDLKPSNILVNHEGTVKLLDFGIAKLLDSDVDPVTMFETTSHKAPFTPAYAAPEQVRGKGISAATDVYALGMILYELLTGRRAYELEPGWLQPKNVELICDHIPSAPSSIATRRFLNEDTGSQNILSALRQSDPIRLKRTLRGDLDAIVMKALKKEPENRYGSATELHDDIERYLYKRPVVAQNDTFRYRTYKFVQRKRSVVIASTLAVLALVAGLVTTANQNRIIRQEVITANRTIDFVSDIFTTIHPDRAAGRAISAEDLVDRGMESLPALDDEPAIKARLLGLMGRLYTSIGFFTQADSTLNEALLLQRQVLNENSPEIAETIFHLLKANNFNSNTADSTKERLTNEALAILDNQRGKKYQEIEIMLLNQSAYDLSLKRNYTQSEELYIQALDKLEAMGSVDQNEEMLDQQGLSYFGLATSLRDRAIPLKDSALLSQALEYYGLSLSIRENLFDPNSPQIATVITGMAQCYYALGQYEQAVAYNERAIEVYRNSFGTKHIAYAINMYKYGNLLNEMGEERTRVKRVFRQSANSFQAVFPRGDYRTTFPLVELGKLYVQDDSFQVAIDLFEESARILDKNSKQAPPNRKSVINYWLGRSKLAAGLLNEAEKHLLENVEKEEINTSDPIYKTSLETLIQLYSQQNNSNLTTMYKARLEAL